MIINVYKFSQCKQSPYFTRFFIPELVGAPSVIHANFARQSDKEPWVSPLSRCDMGGGGVTPAAKQLWLILGPNLELWGNIVDCMTTYRKSPYPFPPISFSKISQESRNHPRPEQKGPPICLLVTPNKAMAPKWTFSELELDSNLLIFSNKRLLTFSRFGAQTDQNAVHQISQLLFLLSIMMLVI